MQFVVELRNRRPSAYYNQSNENLIQFENSTVTRKHSLKLLKVQLAMFLAYLMSFLNAYLVFDSQSISPLDSSIGGNLFGALSLYDVLLILQSLLSVLLVTLTFLQEKLLWENELIRGRNMGSFFGNLRSSWKKLSFALFLELFHPNLLWAKVAVWNHENRFGFEIAPNGETIMYSMNDFCCAIASLRIIFMCYLMLFRLAHNSDTSYRVWCA